MKFAPLLFIVVTTVAVTIATAPFAQAALLVYEGFDSSTWTDNTTLAGFQGDSSVGLTVNNWGVSADTGTSYANWSEDGLAFHAAFPTTGGAAELFGAGRVGAWVEPTAAMGTTRFMSFLVRPDSGLDSSSTRLGGYDNDGAARAPNETSASYVTDRFGGTDSQVRLLGNTAQDGNPLGLGSEFLVVGYLDGLDGAGGSDDTIKMWIFSSAQWNELNNDQSSYSTIAAMDGLTEGTGSNQVWVKLTRTASSGLGLGDVDFVGFVDTAGTVTTYDELRIGSELSDVLFPTSMQVIPEPGSLSLLALAAVVLAGLAYRRRLS